MTRSLVLALALLATPLAAVAAQQGIAQRIGGRLPPSLAAQVQELGAQAAQRGLPVDPMIQKAIEGVAKGVAPERILAAARVVVMQLDTSAAALSQAGLTGDTVAIAAGGFAINAGLSGRDIADLARSGRAVADVIVGLRVAGTLVALGVPPTETVALVSATLESGQPTSELLALPAQVQQGVSRGATPAQAAAGLARAAAAQARRGPPPGRGQPQKPKP